MKKFILSALLLLSLSSISLGVSVDLNQTIEFDNNIGDVSIPSIIVNLSGENLDEFSLLLGSQKIIFIDSYNGDLEYSISNDHKKLTFKGDFENETITIEGLKIRVYGDKINEARIYLDINGDSITDYTSTKYIYVNDDDNDDDTKPLPIKNLSYEINGKNISLSWTKSPDLDIMKQIVRIYKDNNFYMDKFITAGDTSIVLENYDTNSNSYKIEIYAKDQYYSSDSVYIDIPKITNTDITQDIETTEYNQSKYETNSIQLKAIANIIDTKINLKNYNAEKYNQAIEYRNQLIELLDKYLKKEKTMSQTSKEMVPILASLIPFIK
ncbi:hypothetical protein K9M48_01940 [Candidatus Gracilibacteria bacterium]|nr:hypothetical protein [Candidatus Gracilibacteria bacterium]